VAQLAGVMIFTALVFGAWKRLVRVSQTAGGS
jgi:hypothetical protein